LPKAAKTGHLGPRQHQAKVLARAPQQLGRLQQIHAALLLTVIGEVADDDIFGRKSPRLAGSNAVAACAFRDVHAKTLKNDPLGWDAVLDQRRAFARCLSENDSGGLRQRHHGRGRAGTASLIAPTQRIAQVEKGRQKERHAQALRQTAGAKDREGVRKRGSVNHVEMSAEATGGTPHVPGEGIARDRQALPAPLGKQRQRLEQPAPAAKAKR